MSAARGGGIVIKLGAWLVALALIALPVVAIVNGWLAVGHWPLARLKVDADFERVPVEAVQRSVAAHAAAGFFAVDLGAIETAVEALPWVRRAEVRKRWPDLLDVRVHTFEAAARWYDGRLISGDGVLFRVPAESAPPNLVTFTAPEPRAAEALALYRRVLPELGPLGRRLTDVRVTARGSRALGFEGAWIVLGRDDGERRLARLLDTFADARAPETRAAWQRIDLRYANGYAVAWSAAPEPAAPLPPPPPAVPQEPVDGATAPRPEAVAAPMPQRGGA